MRKKELERLVMATTQTDGLDDILSGEQIGRLFCGLVAIGVHKNSHILKYWNLDEYDSVGEAIEFLWRNREELPD